MRLYRRKSIFGWKGDLGLGERLIRQILRGEKTATACPRALYSPAEIEELYKSVGHRVTVIDKTGQPRCTILQTEVLETRFGAPHPVLFLGEGFNTPEEFKQVHLHVWDDLLAQAKVKLTDDTRLLVEVFRLLGSRPPRRMAGRPEAGPEERGRQGWPEADGHDRGGRPATPARRAP